MSNKMAKKIAQVQRVEHYTGEEWINPAACKIVANAVPLTRLTDGKPKDVIIKEEMSLLRNCMTSLSFILQKKTSRKPGASQRPNALQ